MNKKQNIPNFQNGIGVLNYSIQNKSIGISEFYLPQVPNIQTVSAEIYNGAFGWLYGGNNISGTFSKINGFLDNYLKTDIPGLTILKEQNSNNEITYIIHGTCYSNLEELKTAELYNTCSGYIKSYIQYEIKNPIVGTQINNNIESEIFGTLTNLKNNQSISIGGKISGKISGIIPAPSAELENIYFGFYDISGYFINTDFGEDADFRHIQQIKPSNILGRKRLSDKNPLLGKDLHIAPSAIYNELLLEKVNWDVVDYEVITTPLVEVPEIQLPNNTQTVQQPILKLASPKYMKQLARSVKETEVVNNIVFNNTANTFFIAHINNQTVQIIENADIDLYLNFGLIIGPMKTYEDIINILNQYAYTNNYKLYQISKNSFELIND